MKKYRFNKIKLKEYEEKIGTLYFEPISENDEEIIIKIPKNLLLELDSVEDIFANTDKIKKDI